MCTLRHRTPRNRGNKLVCPSTPILATIRSTKTRRFRSSFRTRYIFSCSLVTTPHDLGTPTKFFSFFFPPTTVLDDQRHPRPSARTNRLLFSAHNTIYFVRQSLPALGVCRRKTNARVPKIITAARKPVTRIANKAPSTLARSHRFLANDAVWQRAWPSHSRAPQRRNARPLCCHLGRNEHPECWLRSVRSFVVAGYAICAPAPPPVHHKTQLDTSPGPSFADSTKCGFVDFGQ